MARRGSDCAIFSAILRVASAEWSSTRMIFKRSAGYACLTRLERQRATLASSSRAGTISATFGADTSAGSGRGSTLLSRLRWPNARRMSTATTTAQAQEISSIGFSRSSAQQPKPGEPCSRPAIDRKRRNRQFGMERAQSRLLAASRDDPAGGPRTGASLDPCAPSEKGVGCLLAGAYPLLTPRTGERLTFDLQKHVPFLTERELDDLALQVAFAEDRALVGHKLIVDFEATAFDLAARVAGRADEPGFHEGAQHAKPCGELLPGDADARQGFGERTFFECPSGGFCRFFRRCATMQQGSGFGCENLLGFVDFGIAQSFEPGDLGKRQFGEEL